jgi:hypothetical protein
MMRVVGQDNVIAERLRPGAARGAKDRVGQFERWWKARAGTAQLWGR